MVTRSSLLSVDIKRYTQFSATLSTHRISPSISSTGTSWICNQQTYIISFSLVKKNKKNALQDLYSPEPVYPCVNSTRLGCWKYLCQVMSPSQSFRQPRSHWQPYGAKGIWRSYQFSPAGQISWQVVDHWTSWPLHIHLPATPKQYL